MSRHPGTILRDDFMDPLGLTGAELSRGLGLSRSTISRLLDAQSKLTPSMAARLAAFFGVPARWWLQMQLAWDVHLIEQNPGLSYGVERLELDDSVLLTPDGVLDLSDTPLEEASPVSISLSNRAPLGATEARRQVHHVVYDNGSIALVGEEH
ncbi:MAG: HigA family addiction module antitoxin [Myxococcota bacterium]